MSASLERATSARPHAVPTRRGRWPQRTLTVAVWLAALTPLALLIHDALLGRLGVNPIEKITHETGTASLMLLCATLAVTPVRRLTGWNALARARRPLGLFAFFYAVLHILTFVGLDHFFAMRHILEDVLKRPYITAGTAAFLLLVPLALTSTKAAIRRLGGRWQTLHRLVYPAAALAVLHFYWKAASKADVSEPLLYAGVVAVLLAARLLLRRRRPALSTPSATRRSAPR
jgi:methionine sulfoxide reductase heme-binding subunit